MITRCAHNSMLWSIQHWWSLQINECFVMQCRNVNCEYNIYDNLNQSHHSHRLTYFILSICVHLLCQSFFILDWPTTLYIKLIKLRVDNTRNISNQMKREKFCSILLEIIYCAFVDQRAIGLKVSWNSFLSIEKSAHWMSQKKWDRKRNQQQHRKFRFETLLFT